jgi:C-terminal processing protease CtpA/Prc
MAVLTVGFDGTVAGQGATLQLQDSSSSTIEITLGDATPRRARLGINVSFEPRPTDSLGALIEAVTPGGPADKAGIRSGDVITKLDGHSVSGAAANKKSPGMYLIGLIARPLFKRKCRWFQPLRTSVS